MKRDTTDTFLPKGWFYPNPKNTSFVCIPISADIPTSMTPESTVLPITSTEHGTDTNIGSNVCPAKLFPLDGRPSLQEFSTVCLPLEDPFNLCEDFLGRDHVLHSFIWIVIMLALVGNFLVILVFLGYTVIIKRTKVKLFVVHFFYFNLAIANFLMGIYLLTIAIQDVSTLGNFFHV